VVHCGVDPDVFGVAPPRSPSRDGLTIACVASFEEVKGHEHLVEACAILRRRGIEIRCHLVGMGPLRAATEARVARAGLQDLFHFHGGLPRPQVARLLATVDAVVLASQQTRSGKREGIPVALMEAMATGLPVVASALSGIPELVEDGRTGLLVPPADPHALADALVRLTVDPEGRWRMGAAARRKVLADFDLRENARQLLRLIQGRGEKSVAPAKPRRAPSPPRSYPGRRRNQFSSLT
jgi:glycosyltransferase involved in cell wall biosynthesis